MTLRRFVLPALMTLSLVGASAPSLAGEPAERRSSAPQFSLRDLSGKSVALSDYAGKVVVVSFWATWCAPCLQELPFLDKFYKEYEKKGLVVLAVATDGPETASKIRGVVKRKRFTMPVVHDANGSLVASLNPRATNPYTVFIDRRGRIASQHEGYTPGDEKGYETLIRKLLAEK
jgi:cytochrome c biogenesis protein CcmG/thiol:disulfide interchange protein DsbE